MKVLIAISLFLVSTAAMAQQLSENVTRQAIVRSLVRNYPVACACPYSKDMTGRLCGKRSAYHRPAIRRGYEAPVCYVSDLTPAIITRSELEASSPYR